MKNVTNLEIKSMEDATHVRLDMPGAEQNAACREIFFAFSDARKAILQMSVAKASLEDIFIELTRSEEEEGRK